MVNFKISNTNRRLVISKLAMVICQFKITNLSNFQFKKDGIPKNVKFISWHLLESK